MTSFQFSLFQCLNDKDVCLATTFVPCFTLGKNAELIGKSCLLNGCGFFTCFYGCIGARVRAGIRERYGIAVSVMRLPDQRKQKL